MAMTPGEVCPVCARRPRVVVAVAHRAMRTLIVDLLAREHSCWAMSSVDGVIGLGRAMSSPPDLVVVDAADFTPCCRGPLAGFPLGRVVVIGPEPDPAYRRAVLDQGAGAWLIREQLGEEMSEALRSVLGCTHCPCPPPASDLPHPDASRTERTPTP